MILTPFSIASAISALMTLLVGIATYERLRRNGGNFLSLLMFSLVIWSTFTALDYASPTLPEKIIFAKLEYIGVVFSPLLFFLSVMEIRGDVAWLRPQRVAWLAIIPTISLLFAFSNEGHHLIWTTITMLNDASNTADFGHGVWFWVGVVGYSYLLCMAAVFALVRMAWRSMDIFRPQAVLILFSGFIPLLGNILYVLDFTPFKGYDPSSGLFSISATLFAITHYRFGLLEISPMTINQVTNDLEQAIMIFGQKNQMMMINTAGREFISTNANWLLGAETGWTPKAGEVVNLPAPFNNDHYIFELDTPDGKKSFNSRRTALHTKTGAENGYVLIITDITTEKQAAMYQYAEQMRNERDELLAALDQDLTDLLGHLQKGLALVHTQMESGHITAALGQVEALRLAATNADKTVRLSLFDIISRGKDTPIFSQVLENYLTQFISITGIQVHTSLPTIGIDNLLSTQGYTVLLSALQDCLFNAAKSGSANSAHLVLSVQNNILTTMYSDDARTFKQKLPAVLEKRAHSVGGTLELRQGSTGTQMILNLPLESAEPEHETSLSGTKVIIADRQTAFAETFARALYDRGLRVIGQITNIQQLPAMARDLDPGLVLISSNWPHARLQQVLAELSGKYSGVVAMMFESSDEEAFRISIQGGANALLHKEQSVAEILSGILQALNGGRPIAPQLSLLNQSQATQNPLPREQQAANALLLAGISEKQLEVLKCIAAGKVYKEIAVELNLSESTIKYHVERMQELLGKQNRNELLQHIYSIGFVKDRREDK